MSIVERPSAGELFAASALAMLVSLPTMGAIIASLAWLGEGTLGLQTGAGIVLSGALMGLIGGLPGAPIAVVAGTILYLLLGRALASTEASTGVYKRVHWLALGAVVGALVATVMIIEQTVIAGMPFINFRHHLPLYAPAIVTGMIGMLCLRTVVVALTSRERRA